MALPACCFRVCRSESRAGQQGTQGPAHHSRAATTRACVPARTRARWFRPSWRCLPTSWPYDDCHRRCTPAPASGRASAPPACSGPARAAERGPCRGTCGPQLKSHLEATLRRVSSGRANGGARAVPSHGRAHGDEARGRWRSQAHVPGVEVTVCPPTLASDGSVCSGPRASPPAQPTAARLSRARAVQHVGCGRAGGAHLEREEVGWATQLVARGAAPLRRARYERARRRTVRGGTEAATRSGRRWPPGELLPHSAAGGHCR